jgi:hypothetical protein
VLLAVRLDRLGPEGERTAERPCRVGSHHVRKGRPVCRIGNMGRPERNDGDEKGCARVIGKTTLLAAVAIILVFCSACVSPGLPADSPATTVVLATPQPSPTEKPIPTATPSATPAPSTQASPSPTPPCLATVTPPPTNQAAHPLRVVYIDGGQLALWREETGQITTLATNLAGGFLSPDGRLVAFWRSLDGERDEIWVVGTGGQGERRVAVSDGREIHERHPEFKSATVLRMGWVPSTHTLWYCRVFDAFDTGVAPYGETVRLVDADSGAQPRVIVPPGDVWALAFAPNGQQVAALTQSELRLIDTANARATQAVPFATDSTYRQEILYSPDSRQVLVYVRGGLAIVDAANGQRRDISVDYEPIGWSHRSTFPSVSWLGGGTQAYAIVAQGSNILDVRKPEATFGVWRLDLAKGTATQLRSFTGMGTEAQLSPNCRWLVFSRFVDQNTRELYLADIESGRQLLYDRGDVSPRGWHSNSVQFAYGGLTSPLRLGQLCGLPMHVDQASTEDLSDARSLFLIEGRDDLLIVGHGPGDTYLIELSTFSGQSKRIANPNPEPTGGDVWVGYFLSD